MPSRNLLDDLVRPLVERAWAAAGERPERLSEAAFLDAEAELVALLSDSEQVDAKVWDSGARRPVVRSRTRLKPETIKPCPFLVRGINRLHARTA